MASSSKSKKKGEASIKDFMQKMSKKNDAPAVHTNGHDAPTQDVDGDGPPPPKRPSLNKIEEIYQKKTQLEHILLRPDTYIGSVEPVTELMWVVENEKMVQRQVTYVPGLYKIFDEILVNAADNKQRDKNMDCIKIEIDQENNLISVWNNGQGIPVVEHQKEKMMVPTMIFGHLLTSSNFNDEERKVTGGRNGYGAKLCNVFSNKFTVETATKKYKRALKQSWENNMSKAGEPKIKDFSGDDYTKITFKPDLSKFKMEKLDDDITAIFSRRAYDIAASSRGVKVYLNGTRVPVKGFKDYVDLFLKDRTDEIGNPLKFAYEVVNDRWEIACSPSDNGFQQISFVNSIATTKGGRHVDYVADHVIKNLIDTVKKKNKNGFDIKPFQVRNHMWIFVNCLIENPTFDSQTKEMMTLQAKNFGSKCIPSEKFFTGVIKCGIVESVLQWAKFKADNMLSKGSGKKTSKLKGIPKLEDANDAGTKNSIDCTLILTEGDSAKTLAVAGLGVVGRDRYGVFPLRGKLLNVREASHKQIVENAEINALVKILGLQYKKKYNSFEDLRTLRYGKVMIMTDQDQDGSHIKGLIINFIHHNWPSLLQLNFLEEFITPIVKVSKGNTVQSFFSLPELEDWKHNTPNWKTYKLKYYKGLGTSTSKEAKEYFTDMQRHRIKFKYQGSKDDDKITMAFSKKCIEERKTWLTSWMDNTKRNKELGVADEFIYSSTMTHMSYTDFIDKELVLFSNMDNERSIPCLVDGFKPGQRKVLFTCFKRNLDKKEIKVAQLAGSVAELSAYHHGEQSLMSTIINLAQNYVGSNNINLLQPIGQFGTRLQGGKDSASPRYIFTRLSPLTKCIFHKDDEPLLKYLFDDNMRIEPVWYCPIIPMVLVNGSDGIGTGWMTKIPNFNPREIIKNLFRLLDGVEPRPMKPWYKNFKGEILEIDSQKYASNGVVSMLGDTKIEITELPIGTWTQSYKESVIEPMHVGSEKVTASLTDYKEYHTDTSVRFVLSMKENIRDKYEQEGFHKVFKLQSAINLTSMVLFDQNGCLKRYNNVNEILREFYELRIDLYAKRKAHMLGLLEAEALKLTNQARFIVEKCDGKLVIENKKLKTMIAELVSRKYDSDPVKAWQAKLREGSIEVNAEEEENTRDEVGDGPDFRYLYTMSIHSLTLEKKEALLRERDEKQQQVAALKVKTPPQIYREDLNALLAKLDEVEKAEEEEDKNTKKKLVGKKGFSKKAEMEIYPSMYGIKVEPVIDEMVKKAELAVKAKENKGKGRTKKVKEEVEVKDEFDMMLEENGEESKSPFANKKASTTAPKRAVKKEKDDKDAKPKKPRAPRKKKNFSDSDMSDDDDSPSPKKSKAKASPKKRVKKEMFSDDDFDSPKKKKGKKKGGDSSDDEFVVNLDSSIESIPSSPGVGRQRRTKAKAKYVFDDEEEEEKFSDSD